MSFSYRKTWKCGERWIDGGLTIDIKNGCGCDIYQSKEKHRSGKYKIFNLRDGQGGPADTPHICPNRVGSKFHHIEKINIRKYDYSQQNWPCICGAIYNKEVFPICPVCMKLECRVCGNLQHWVAGKGLDCFKCGARCDPRSVRYQLEQFQ